MNAETVDIVAAVSAAVAVVFAALGWWAAHQSAHHAGRSASAGEKAASAADRSASAGERAAHAAEVAQHREDAPKWKVSSDPFDSGWQIVASYDEGWPRVNVQGFYSGAIYTRDPHGNLSGHPIHELFGLGSGGTPHTKGESLPIRIACPDGWEQVDKVDLSVTLVATEVPIGDVPPRAPWADTLHEEKARPMPPTAFYA